MVQYCYNWYYLKHLELKRSEIWKVDKQVFFDMLLQEALSADTDPRKVFEKEEESRRLHPGGH